MKWLTVTLIKDVNDEGFRGSKSSMLVTTKAERMNREAAKTSSDDTDLLWEGVAIPGTPPTHTNGPEAAARFLQGQLRRQWPYVEKPTLKIRSEPRSCFWAPALFSCLHH